MNTVGAVLLAEVVALTVFVAVGLLVFSLVELLSSAVAGLAVLGFSSIVEIMPCPCHPHPYHLYQQCKKKEKKFLPHWLMFYHKQFVKNRGLNNCF